MLDSFYGTGLQREQELKADAPVMEAASSAASITGELLTKSQARQAVCHVRKKLHCCCISMPAHYKSNGNGKKSTPPWSDPAGKITKRLLKYPEKQTKSPSYP